MCGLQSGSEGRNDCDATCFFFFFSMLIIITLSHKFDCTVHHRNHEISLMGAVDFKQPPKQKTGSNHRRNSGATEVAILSLLSECNRPHWSA